MKKCLFMILAVCAVVLSACSDDDNNNNKVMPQLSPNNTNISVDANGGTKTLTIGNAVDLNITQINNKTTDANKKTTDTNVLSVSNGKIADPKNVTEGGWFTAKVDGKNIVIAVSKNSDTQNARDKYIHVTCGGNIYGLSLHLMQSKAAESNGSN